MFTNQEKKRYFASSDYILREIAGEQVLIAVGQEIADFCGIVNLNRSAAVLWKAMQSGATLSELTAQLLEQFEVSEEQAAEDAARTIEMLAQRGMIHDE